MGEFKELIEQLHQRQVIVSMAADMMSLLLLQSPGSLGADVVFGSAQRFGVPMGFGGPHAAFFVTRDAYKRAMPGRIIGVSKDARGNTALRMAMQTREQHIRREKANSNICTAQVLLANMASFYAVYHGPQGLKKIAQRINRFTDILALGLQSHAIELVNQSWFDTLTFKVDQLDVVLARAEQAQINLRIDDEAGQLGVSLDETTTRADLQQLFEVILGADHGLKVGLLDERLLQNQVAELQGLSADKLRDDPILTHKTFNAYHGN